MKCSKCDKEKGVLGTDGACGACWVAKLGAMTSPDGSSLFLPPSASASMFMGFDLAAPGSIGITNDRNCTLLDLT